MHAHKRVLWIRNSDETVCKKKKIGVHVDTFSENYMNNVDALALLKYLGLSCKMRNKSKVS